MDRWSMLFAPLVGRILVGGYFLCSGIEDALNFPASVQFLATYGLPQPVSLAVLFITIEVIGGIMLVIGLKSRPTTLALAIFILLKAGLYAVGVPTDTSIIFFLQNMAIVGGLLYL